MGAIRATQCRICGAAREEGSPDVLCLEHRRERDRLRRREELGIPLDLPGPKARMFPRGTCSKCGGPVDKQGLCREHRLEYQRTWAEARRRAKGMAVRKKTGPRENAGVCKICGKPRHTRPYTRAAVCEEHLREDTRRRMQSKREKKRKLGPVVRVPAYVPKVRPQQPDIAIGPEAFAKPEPVSVEGREVVRVRVPFEAIEASEREREWAEWFAARGL